MLVTSKGIVGNTVPGSAAASAGIAPGMTIVAVNGRAWSLDRLLEAIDDAQRTRSPIMLLVQNASFVRSVSVPYYGGQRYAALERIPNTPDMLSKIFSPKTYQR
jgi:predicted metalloprotease with PDZ domain